MLVHASTCLLHAYYMPITLLLHAITRYSNAIKYFFQLLLTLIFINSFSPLRPFPPLCLLLLVTAHGVGVYFAVNASYSANPRYTPPDASGHRRMYVARVLTGRYTLGDPTMRFTPRRSPTDSADRYDSLVDNLQRPSMFVIFHDDQAYPEYLITFI